MAITRFVNGVTGRAVGGGMHGASSSSSVLGLARSVGMPEVCVLVRHTATHQTLPFTPLLVHAAQEALDWLEKHYWAPQDAAIGTARSKVLAIVEKLHLRRIERLIGLDPDAMAAARSLTKEERSLVGQIIEEDKGYALPDILAFSFLLSPSAQPADLSVARVFWWEVVYALGSHAPWVVSGLFANCVKTLGQVDGDVQTKAKAAHWACVLARSPFISSIPIVLVLDVAASAPSGHLRKLVKLILKRSSPAVSSALRSQLSNILKLLTIHAGLDIGSPILAPPAQALPDLSLLTPSGDVSAVWKRVDPSKWRPAPIGHVPPGLVKRNAPDLQCSHTTGLSSLTHSLVFSAPSPRPHKRHKGLTHNQDQEGEDMIVTRNGKRIRPLPAMAFHSAPSPSPSPRIFQGAHVDAGGVAPVSMDFATTAEGAESEAEPPSQSFSFGSIRIIN